MSSAFQQTLIAFVLRAHSFQAILLMLHGEIQDFKIFIPLKEYLENVVIQFVFLQKFWMLF